MARTFTSASSEKINLSLGAGGSLSTFTIAAIALRGSDGATQTIISIGVGSGSIIQLRLTDTNLIGLYTAGNLRTDATMTAAASDGWVFYAASRDSSNNGTLYKYVYSTDTWTQGSTTNQFGSTPATSTHIGGRSDGWQYFNGSIAGVGAWNAVLTQAQVRALAYSLSAWWQIQPNGLWILDQDTTSQKVVDLTGNGANESGISGTSVSTSAVPVLSYAASPVFVTRGTGAAPPAALWRPRIITLTGW